MLVKTRGVREDIHSGVAVLKAFVVGPCALTVVHAAAIGQQRKDRRRTRSGDQQAVPRPTPPKSGLTLSG
jgi:hypothetical protein